MQRKKSSLKKKTKNSLYNIYILKPKAVSTNQKPYLNNVKHHNLSFRQYFPCMQLHHIWEDDIPAFVSWFLRRSLSRDSRVSKLSAYHQL